MKEICLQGWPLNRHTLYRIRVRGKRGTKKRVLFYSLLLTSHIFDSWVSDLHTIKIILCALWLLVQLFLKKGPGKTTLLFRWPHMKFLSQIHFCFSTWSQMFEMENSRPGTQRGKLGVFSQCPLLSFEDKTSWPFAGKALQPYVSEVVSWMTQAPNNSPLVINGKFAMESHPFSKELFLAQVPLLLSGNASWPIGLYPVSFFSDKLLFWANLLALFLESTVQEPCLFPLSSLPLTTTVTLYSITHQHDEKVFLMTLEFFFPTGLWFKRMDSDLEISRSIIYLMYTRTLTNITAVFLAQKSTTKEKK